MGPRLLTMAINITVLLQHLFLPKALLTGCCSHVLQVCSGIHGSQKERWGCKLRALADCRVGSKAAERGPRGERPPLLKINRAIVRQKEGQHSLKPNNKVLSITV
jgi:hypothetical protein